MILNQEYIDFMMKDIKENRGKNDEGKMKLKRQFSTYDELMECTLFFHREMIKKGMVAARAIKRLRELGVDTEKLVDISTLELYGIYDDTMKSMQNIINYQIKLKKNIMRPAYKSEASIEKCVELYTKYQNINKIADELGVSHMTVRRRLEEAKRRLD